MCMSHMLQHHQGEIEYQRYKFLKTSVENDIVTVDT